MLNLFYVFIVIQGLLWGLLIISWWFEYFTTKENHINKQDIKAICCTITLADLLICSVMHMTEQRLIDESILDFLLGYSIGTLILVGYDILKRTEGSPSPLHRGSLLLPIISGALALVFAVFIWKTESPSWSTRTYFYSITSVTQPWNFDSDWGMALTNY